MKRRRCVFERLRPVRGEAGFSLIEVLVALTVFTIMTLGLVPLLVASVRGAAEGRSYTTGKNVVVEAMERVRGLPFHVSFSAENIKVDVLDLYFPSYAGSVGNIYTTTCTSTTSNPACPPGIPTGHTLTFAGRFVTPAATTPESYTTKVVPTTYAWNSSTGGDAPPGELFHLKVTGSWTQAGGQSYSLESLFSNRRFSVTQPAAAGGSPLPVANLKLRAVGRVNYVVRAETGYVFSGDKTEMTARTNSASARLEQGSSVLGEMNSRSFEATVIRPPEGTATAATDAGSLVGATSFVAAPPDNATSGAIADAELTHPDSGSGRRALMVAGHGDTETAAWASLNYFGLNWPWSSYLNVYGYNYADNNGNKIIEAYAKGQMDTAAPLRLVDTRNTLQVQQQTAGSYGTEGAFGFMFSYVIADANQVDNNRRAVGYATAQAWDIFFLPVSFAPTSPALQSLVHIQDFRATLQCRSTGNPATAFATATWSATLKYWRDTTNNGVLNGSYATVSLAGNLGTDPLQAIKTSNPLVYDGSTAAADVYLFDNPSTTAVDGYLTDWKSIATIPTSEDAAGQVTTASLTDAITIQTVPLTPGTTQTDMTVAVGNLECVGEDYR